MNERIGLYGGSFDPIHHGHLIVARAVAERLGLKRVYLLPSSRPPHKESADLAGARHRAAMVALAIAEEPLFAMSDFDLTRTGPSYTIDTIAHFQRQLGLAAELFWIIGADWLADLPTWHRASDLLDSCRIVTAARPGWTGPDRHRLIEEWGQEKAKQLEEGVVETPLIDISSTQIRQRVRDGRSIRFLVPDSVAEYIALERLYTA